MGIAMASVRKWKGSWQARYRGPDGRQHSRSFDRKVDAERFLTTMEAAKLRGDWVDPAHGRRHFGEVAREWQAAQVHRPSTREQVEFHLRKHILPSFAERPIAAVRPSEVQAWVKGRSSVLAPATVEVAYRYLAAIFRFAVEDGLITTTPCRNIKLPKIERLPVEPLTTEQVWALIDAMPERYRALVILAAGSGLRQGEALGLTVPRVDFLRRSLRVEEQLLLLTYQPPYLAPPKTAASRRVVPLPPIVLESLAAHIAAFPPGPWQLVFTDEKGGPILRNRFSERVFRPAANAAGLPKGRTFHDLRHYYASLLIRHGESVKVVQSRLGHASAKETLDTYSHLWPDSEDRTRQAVETVLRRPAVEEKAGPEA
jgi:integrase